MGMFLKNTQYNVKYFDLNNWWISQQSNNIPTRYQIISPDEFRGALEIRVSVYKENTYTLKGFK